MTLILAVLRAARCRCLALQGGRWVVAQVDRFR